MEKLRCYRAARAAIEIACVVEKLANATGHGSTFHGEFSGPLKSLKEAAHEVKKDVSQARDLANQIHTRAGKLEKIVRDLGVLNDDHKRVLNHEGFLMRGYALEIQSRAIGTCGGKKAPVHRLEALPPIPKKFLQEGKKAEAKVKKGEAASKRYFAQIKKGKKP